MGILWVLWRYRAYSVINRKAIAMFTFEIWLGKILVTITLGILKIALPTQQVVCQIVRQAVLAVCHVLLSNGTAIFFSCLILFIRKLHVV